MTRCAFAGLALTLGMAVAAPAEAEGSRSFPANALRGEIVVRQPPEITLNGEPARLAPGVRIRGANNLLLMSAAMVGQPVMVNYTLDLQGQVLQAWVLTDEERAKKPWPATLQQAREWRFDPAAQAWSKP